MAVATCHEIANGSCNLPFGLQTLRITSATCKSLYPGTRQFDWRFHLPAISPMARAICSCACATRCCQWRVQAAVANPPVPLMVCLHHACNHVEKCPLEKIVLKPPHLEKKFLKLSQMGKFAAPNLGFITSITASVPNGKIK